MASLREIKDHIASVRSTLKITSAMKLVASAKLRKAQQAAEGIRPYTEALAAMVASVDNGGNRGCYVPQGDSHSPAATAPAAAGRSVHSSMQNDGFCIQPPENMASRMQNGLFCIPEGGQKVAVVAVASNSSLCGAFNVNVIRRTQELVEQLRRDGAGVEVFSLGRKMADAMKKAGCPSPADYSDLVGHSSFDKTAALAQMLIEAYNSGRYGRILLVYNHFVSTSSQKVQVETYLPFLPDGQGGADLGSGFILEPSRDDILATLLPQVLRLRLHSAILDSIAAEHAARTIAMQTASDNAEELLDTLTLEYNKGRQQKITAEILDIVGGSQQ